jgi:hypothetical protein
MEPHWFTVPTGTGLARVYYTSSGHPLAWNEFRCFGPLHFRWDHHETLGGEPCEQARAVYYASTDATTCLAEVFQSTRRIDRVYQAPWIVVFKTQGPLVLLDLTGGFADRLGATMAIHCGSRQQSRSWARDLYAAFPGAHGIRYASAMHGGAPAFALNERSLRAAAFPPHPEFHRALADDLLLDPLKHAAQVLGYALR